SCYDLKAIGTWWRERERRRLRPSTQTNGHDTDAALELDRERARLARVQARRAELQVRRAEGELAPVAEMAKVVRELLELVRSRLLALPTALARIVDAEAKAGGPRAVEAVLRDRIGDALHELADWRPPAVRDATGHAANSDPERLGRT